MICLNRDLDGKCLAYKVSNCHKGCTARITSISAKIKLMRELLHGAHAKKERRRLTDELNAAIALRDSTCYEGWMSGYLEDKRRGGGGGASEKDANRATSMKTLMNDNRPIGIKPTRGQLAEWSEMMKLWEEENGKLERLGRTSMSSSKVDSYTGDPICFVANGEYCNGQRAATGYLAKQCKACYKHKEYWVE